MKRCTTLALIVVMLLSFRITGSAQTEVISRYAINIGIGREKVGIPFRKVFDFPAHSSYYLGFERRWSKNAQHAAFQTLDTYVVTNTSAGSGYALQSALGYEIKFLNTFYFSPSAGLGILHLFKPKQSFMQVDGSYEASTDYGKVYPEIFLNLKLGNQLKQFGVFDSYQAGGRYFLIVQRCCMHASG